MDVSIGLHSCGEQEHKTVGHLLWGGWSGDLHEHMCLFRPHGDGLRLLPQETRENVPVPDESHLIVKDLLDIATRRNLARSFHDSGKR